jgi:hypothetical protein
MHSDFSNKKLGQLGSPPVMLARSGNTLTYFVEPKVPIHLLVLLLAAQVPVRAYFQRLPLPVLNEPRAGPTLPLTLPKSARQYKSIWPPFRVCKPDINLSVTSIVRQKYEFTSFSHLTACLSSSLYGVR